MNIAKTAVAGGAVFRSGEDRLRGGQPERPADSAWSVLTTIVLRPSAVQGRLGQPYPATGVGNSPAVSRSHLGLSEVVNDLL